jgi:hypothetical protein
MKLTFKSLIKKPAQGDRAKAKSVAVPSTKTARGKHPSNSAPSPEPNGKFHAFCQNAKRAFIRKKGKAVEQDG